MATHVTLKITGIKEYMEKLDAVGKDIDKVAYRALRKGANVLRKGMRRRAPKDTGNLRNKIQIKGPVIKGTKIEFQVGVIHERAYTDAKTAIYANVQEYGSANTPAHPYIRPTMQEDGSAAWAAVTEDVKKYLKDVGLD